MTVSRGSGSVTGGSTFENYDEDNVTIKGGSINNTTIGAGTASTGDFTTLTSNDLSSTTFTLGSGSFTTISDLGTVGTAAFTAITNLGSVTTCDINGGTIDGVTIGASSAPTVTNLGSVTTCDINGGTIDGVTIGGAAATTIGANATISSSDTLPAGTVVQVVNVQDGAVATGTTVLPYDDTIPQNTEGDEYMTLSITPKYADSKLKIDVFWAGSINVTTIVAVALFQDTTADALAVANNRHSTASYPHQIGFTHWMTSGTTSSTTFKVRAGPASAGTTTFNGASSARLYGGVLASSITITEIKQ